MDAYNAPFPGESALVFKYFVEYRDLGPTRTLRKLETLEIEGRTRNLRQIGRWSANFNWQVRVTAYDEDVARATTARIFQERVKATQSFVLKDMELISGIQEKLSDWLNSEKEKTIEEYHKWTTSYSKVREMVYDNLLLLPSEASDIVSEASDIDDMLKALKR